MKFINRLGYYLGGFAIGLVILAFILNGKDASCDYSPNARTVKNITSKPITYSASAKELALSKGIDSLDVINLIKYGDVAFNKSIINEDSCNTYVIENSFKEQPVELTIMNCESQAFLADIKMD